MFLSVWLLNPENCTIVSQGSTLFAYPLFGLKGVASTDFITAACNGRGVQSAARSSNRTHTDTCAATLVYVSRHRSSFLLTELPRRC